MRRVKDVLTLKQNCTALNEFVVDELVYIDALTKAEDNYHAYWELGRALHPIMDSTSPPHSGFNEWNLYDFYEHGDILPTSDESDISDSLLDETVARMNNAVNGGKLDCSCYE